MNKSYLVVIGERLKMFRQERGISLEDVADKGGITLTQVEAVEKGEEESLSAFVGYIHGSDLYMFFSEKSPNRMEPHDFNDMAEKAVETDKKRTNGK